MARRNTGARTLVTIGGTTYAARVLQHSAFDIQTASDQGVDGSPRISIVLANADSHFSEIERATGWKGAQLTVGFLFYDLRKQRAAYRYHRCVSRHLQPAGPDQRSHVPADGDESDEPAASAASQVRIQRRCPLAVSHDTGSAEPRQSTGGANGKYSLFYRCGYSADLTGGTRNPERDGAVHCLAAIRVTIARLGAC